MHLKPGDIYRGNTPRPTIRKIIWVGGALIKIRELQAGGTWRQKYVWLTDFAKWVRRTRATANHSITSNS